MKGKYLNSLGLLSVFLATFDLYRFLFVSSSIFCQESTTTNFRELKSCCNCGVLMLKLILIFKFFWDLSYNLSKII